MNQAALHQFMVSEYLTPKKDKDFEALYELRLATNLMLIKQLYFSLYPSENKSDSLKKLLQTMAALFDERPVALKQDDIKRQKLGNWYQSEKIVGMQLYVDHFNNDIKGITEKIGYFEKLGINFLHLMPITPRPKGENDGGYAVNSYYEVDGRYGTKEDLTQLTDKLRDKDMYLMLDLVINHTSNEHPWAKKAIQGDQKYQAFYFTFPDRKIPDAYEKSLPEIFPITAPGNFTYEPKMYKWVMTVFNQFQWDLNYANPEVFLGMLENLIKLVNLGVDVVRLDALAFLWKKLGTESQNLPEAHALISLFRMCLQVIAPGVVFLAEAIVAPKEIIKYFGEGERMGNECEIAYNATLMALLWDAVATKKTLLLYKNLQNLPSKPLEATWINYIRCHDDIGLGFEDHYINEIGWDAQKHRKFLLDYYCQIFPWSPAKGLIFMYNPKTGDGRITGSTASLLGLEKALFQNDPMLIQQSIDKIIMMYGIILSYGGIPLIYAGDEIGTLNDYSFQTDKNKKSDTRWVNRPNQDWETIANLEKVQTYHSKIFTALQKLIKARRKNPVFADDNSIILYNHDNPHVFIYERTSDDTKGVLVICNFDEAIQSIDLINLGSYGMVPKVKDLVTGKSINIKAGKMTLKPYQLSWLAKA